MIAIPNMDKPKACEKCPTHSFAFGDEYVSAHDYCGVLKKPFNVKKLDIDPFKEILPDCPLIEVDDEGIQKAKKCLTVIKAMWRRFKIKVNESEELKQELLGMDSNLTIIDESYGERATDE